VCHWNFC